MEKREGSLPSLLLFLFWLWWYEPLLGEIMLLLPAPKPMLLLPAPDPNKTISFILPYGDSFKWEKEFVEGMHKMCMEVFGLPYHLLNRLL